MEINYIILTHKNPLQVKRLIQRLDCKNVNFYIHVDSNSEIGPFKKELKQFSELFFLEGTQRRPGTWGDIGIVEATLNALKQIKEDNRNGYCLLLSGQDYPLSKNEDIKLHLRKNYGTCFIEIFPMPGGWGSTGLDRIHKYKTNKSPKRGHFLLLPSIFDKEFYTLQTAGKINFLRKKKNYDVLTKLFLKRRFPSYLTPFGGSQWWALPMEVIEDILNFNDEHPDYLAYHRYTLLPDEIFFQSIVMYLKKNKKIKIMPSLTYVNWFRKSGPLPVTFTTSDFEELKQATNEKRFARKFDIHVEENILNCIDDVLLK